MPRGKLTFRQRDVAAAIKAAKLAGCEVTGVTVDRDGKIKVQLTSSKEKPIQTSCANEWDEVLKSK